MGQRSTPEMLRVLRLALHDMQGRVEAGKLAVVEQAIGHIREQSAVIQMAEGALPADKRTHRALRARIARLSGQAAPKGEGE